jgi:hypothetical protein
MYGGIINEMGKMIGVGKFDLARESATSPKSIEEGGVCEGLFLYGPGKYGGEAIFVPRSPGMEGEEDDGYLIGFVHDETNGYQNKPPPTVQMLTCHGALMLYGVQKLTQVVFFLNMGWIDFSCHDVVSEIVIMTLN